MLKGLSCIGQDSADYNVWRKDADGDDDGRGYYFPVFNGIIMPQAPPQVMVIIFYERIDVMLFKKKFPFIRKSDLAKNYNNSDFLAYAFHVPIRNYSAIPLLRRFVVLLYNCGFIDDVEFYFQCGLLDEYAEIFPELLRSNIQIATNQAK